MTTGNRFAKFAQAFAFFALIAAFAAAAFPSASHASARTPKAPALTGKVTVIVLDQSSGKPLQNAMVVFHRSDDARIVTRYYTNADGQVSVELTEALYTVEVAAKQYKPAYDIVKVAAGEHTEAKIALNPDSTVSTPPPPMQ